MRGTVYAMGVAATLLSACAVGPDFVRPPGPDTDAYTRGSMPDSTASADDKVQHFRTGAAVIPDWWRLFRSEPLDALVRQAIAGNPTLQASEASLRRSQDNLLAGYGVFFPQADAGLSASRQRSAPAVQGLSTAGSIFNLVTLTGNISYALDIFGGARRAVEGLRAEVDNQSFANRAAYVALTANVVNAAIARAGYEAQIRSTEQLIELQRQQLESAAAQVRAGTAPYSSVLSLRGFMAANQAALAPLKQRVAQTEHLLSTLEGQFPSKSALPEIDLDSIVLPLDLPVSVPSDLVRQRPDILSAEAQLHTASANIGVATAAMFPSFSLSATYGAVGSNIGNLSAASAKFWNFGPSLALPVFRGGSLWYGRKAAIESYRQAEATYRETVLAAFAQVADTLTALQHDAEGLQAQALAQRAAAEALRLLQINYRAGMVAYLDVLAADVQLHQTTVAYLQLVAQRHQDTVALFVALGGGWWNGPSTASSTAPK